MSNSWTQTSVSPCVDYSRPLYSLSARAVKMSPKILWILFGGLMVTIPGYSVSDGLQVARPLTGEVTYSSQSLCVLQGASVVLTCSYTAARKQPVWSTFWFSPKLSGNWWSEEQPEDLLLDPEFAGHVAYSRTEDRSSTLTITDLRLSDSGVYRCLFTSDQGTHSDLTGVNLTVTDLMIKMVGRTSMDLSCSTLCSLEFKMLDVPSEVKFLYFNIYKNGQHKNHTYPKKLTLPLSSGDGGSYSCTVGGLDDLRSHEVCVLADRCWGVSYSDRRVCALRGSSVQLFCSYTYPRGHTVTSAFWFNKWEKGENPTDLLSMEDFEDRVTYLGNMQDHSNLTIRDVRERDAGEYRFRFTTNDSYFGKPGVILNVTGLQVRMSADHVSEGQKVTLTCSTTCTLSNNPTYLWYKNANPLPHRHTTRSNRLYLMSVSSEDGGDYTCAVKEHDHLTSSAVTLSISHSGSENHPAVYASVGILLLLLLAVSLVCGVLWMRRRRSSSSQETETTGGNGKTHPSTVCSSDPTKVEDLEDENDIQYSSIQFRQPNNGNNNLQPAQREDAGVLYATVKVPSTELV
ncbi:sialoadhesin-like isoform X1 [Alosa pseudoharengus]|uniref:sialoadhesin-like isoform X1 n=1 Tax=Alosa pseudoharengus TaxID=34774 RepID=UPI003F8A4EA5